MPLEDVAKIFGDQGEIFQQDMDEPVENIVDETGKPCGLKTRDCKSINSSHVEDV